MKKSKILISAVTMFSLCITPMSVYAQVDPNSNIENTISQTKSAENLPTPVLQEKEIEVSNGTGYSLNNIQGAETVKALEQGTIVISYKATGENAIQSLFSVGNGTNGNQNRHFHIYVTNSGGVGMELRNTDGDFKYTLDRPAAVRGSYKGERVSNTIAFKADKENKADRVLVCGCGSSGLSAKEMEIRFMRIGIDVDSMTDSDMIKMASVFQNRRSLIFGFSISGEREEVTYLLREAYNKGAKTVLFTTNNGKKFSEYYSEVVALSSLRHLNYGNVISPQFPILIILDIIYAYYVEQNKYIREGMHDSTLCASEIKNCLDDGMTVLIKKAKANNSTKDNEFRKDKFKYDPEKDVYICPAEQQLYFFENTSKNGMKYK